MSAAEFRGVASLSIVSAVATAVGLIVFSTLTACDNKNHSLEQPSASTGRIVCPQCDQPLRDVPILIGLPDAEMEQSLREGKVLLGGCMGIPGQDRAWVCDRCRRWTSGQMRDWQPLPREFGAANQPTEALFPDDHAQRTGAVR